MAGKSFTFINRFSDGRRSILPVLIGVGISAFIIYAIICKYSLSTFKNNLIFFKNTNVDLGFMPPNTEREAVFHYFNNQGKSVRIRDVVVSCGCLSVNSTKDLILPGESGSIKINISSKGFVGINELRKTADVYFESNSIPSIQLGIVARVQPYVEVTPQTLTFSQVGDSTQSITIDRVSLDSIKFKHLNIQSDDLLYNIKEVTATADKKVFSVNLKYNYSSYKLPDLNLVSPAFGEVNNLLRLCAIQCFQDGPKLLPSAYAISFGITPVKSVEDKFPQKFRLIADNNIAITKVNIPNTISDFFSCVTDKNDRSFFLSMEKIPSDEVLNTEFIVEYRDVKSGQFGKIFLPVQVVQINKN